MLNNRYENPYPYSYPLERIIAAASYITMGMAGFIWIIIGAVTRQNIRPFLKFNIFQSIFLSLLFFILSAFLSFIFGIFGAIPFIGNIISTSVFYVTVPMFLSFSVINAVMSLFILYLAITSLLGLYSYIPWVSNIIRANVR